MSTNPNPIVDQFISGIQAIEGQVTQEANQIAADQVTIAGENATIANDATVLAGVKAQLAAALATIAAGATAFIADGLEQTQWLLAGGTLANSNQTGSTANAVQSVPGVGGCASLQIIPNGPWADAYWYKEFGPKNDKTHYKYEFGFMFPSVADSNAAHCLELDLEQHVGGIVFNCGLQFGFDNNTIRIWDRSEATISNPGGGQWIATGAACPRWAAGTWVRGIWQCHRDAGNVYYDSLVVNGVNVPVSQFSFPSPNLGYSDKMDVAIQSDSNGSGTPFKVLLDALRFTAS